MMEIITSVEFWKFSAPLLGAVIAWFINESPSVRIVVASLELL